ncbi:hypothetical protein BKI51_07195 [Alphaproteobacteria bacterium AO1-B]|nr:hypothetical protein BKI51_07195 [Alphaproteobacteria bacterium AO1-B]
MGQELSGRSGRDIKARLWALIDQMDEAAVAAFLAELQVDLQGGRQVDLQAELPADPDRSRPDIAGLGEPDLGAPDVGGSGLDLADAGRLRPAGTKDG